MPWYQRASCSLGGSVSRGTRRVGALVPPMATALTRIPSPACSNARLALGVRSARPQQHVAVFERIETAALTAQTAGAHRASPVLARVFLLSTRVAVSWLDSGFDARKV
jgi:hypothetical protein